MHITVSEGRALLAGHRPGTFHALLLGARLASHDMFGLCCRLVGRSDRALHLDQIAAAGLRKAWQADGTLAVLNAGWNLVLMLESAARIAAEPDRYGSLARVLSFAARSGGARVALVQPPPERRAAPWRTVDDTVDAAADGAHADIVPVGAAWQLALEMHPGLPLDEPDGRMTVLGAYLVACTLAHYVAGPALPLLDLPGVPRRDIGAVHRAAQESLRTTAARPERLEEGQLR